jgi:hypothetical protein
MLSVCLVYELLKATAITEPIFKEPCNQTELVYISDKNEIITRHSGRK